MNELRLDSGSSHSGGGQDSIGRQIARGQAVAQSLSELSAHSFSEKIAQQLEAARTEVLRQHMKGIRERHAEVISSLEGGDYISLKDAREHIRSIPPNHGLLIRMSDKEELSLIRIFEKLTRAIGCDWRETYTTSREIEIKLIPLACFREYEFVLGLEPRFREGLGIHADRQHTKLNDRSRPMEVSSSTRRAYFLCDNAEEGIKWLRSDDSLQNVHHSITRTHDHPTPKSRAGMDIPPPRIPESFKGMAALYGDIL